jgi:hypothetical protein
LEEKPVVKEAKTEFEPEPIPTQKKKEGKRVKFHSDLESIKFFKLTDLPTGNSLSVD